MALALQLVILIAVSIATEAKSPQPHHGSSLLYKFLHGGDTGTETNKFPATLDDKIRMALFKAHSASALTTKFTERKSRTQLMERLKKVVTSAQELPGKIRAATEHLKLDMLEEEDLEYTPIEMKYDVYEQNYANCNRHLGAFLFAIFSWLSNFINGVESELPEYAWKLVDAMGSIPEGIDEGKLHWVGSYQYCNRLQLNHTYSTPGSAPLLFNGRYCRAEVGDPELPVENDTEISLGLCIPDTCNTLNATYVLQNHIVMKILGPMLGMEIRHAYCGNEGNFSDDHVALGVLGFSAAIAALLVFGTLFDVIRRLRDPDTANDSIRATCTVTKATNTRQDPYVNAVSYPDAKQNGLHKTTEPTLDTGGPSLLLRIALSFSVVKGIEHIINTNVPEDDLGCLRGIRVLSLSWIILGHTFLFGVVYAETWTTGNLLTAMDILFEDWWFQAILNFHFAADSFFVVSGLLVAYLFLKNVEYNNGEVSPLYVCYSIIHRYWRLIVPYMLFIGFYVGFYKYLNEGPFAPEEVGDAVNCKSNWWVNLLLQVDLVRNDQPCLLYTWFISTVFKFHILGIIIMVIFMLQPIAAYIIMAGCVVGHIIATGVLSNRFTDPDSDEIEDYYSNVIIAPWCRVAPYIMGMAAGIVVAKRPRLQINKVVNIVMWLVSLTLIFAIVYSPYDQYREGGEEWPKSQQVAYDTFSRVAFGLGIAWIAMACLTGNGGVVNRMLGWKAWVPLDRVGYMCFIVHGLLIFRYAYNKMTLIHVDENSLGYMFIGHVGFIYLLGTVASLLYQWPFYFLEDAILPPAVRHGTKDAAIMAESAPSLCQKYETPRERRKKDNEYALGNFKKNDPSDI